jgi:putative peptidoglycan lipid II flippase
MPQVIIAQAISIAALPAFSAMAARGEVSALRASLADTMRLILFLALPATVGLSVLSMPVVALLFERGRFTDVSTALVTNALVFFTLGLVSHSVVEIVSRSYYALKDTWTPVWVGASAMALNTALNFPLATWFTAFNAPHAGLALANTLATTLEMFALVWLLRRRLNGLDFARVWPGLWRTGLAALGMGTALLGWVWLLNGQAAWLISLGGVALGGAAFWLLAVMLRAPEARLLPEMVWQKFRPRTNTNKPE